MMDRQNEQFEIIQKAYGMDVIDGEYIYSMIKPLHYLLENIIIKKKVHSLTQKVKFILFY
jgi:hypothetical protein